MDKIVTELFWWGWVGGRGSEGSEMTERRLRNSFVPLVVNGNVGAEAAAFYSEGTKVVQFSKITSKRGC